MKKIINPKSIPFIVVACSIIGMVLRIWTQGGGPDVFGLYPEMPLAWGVLGLFSVALVAALIVALRPLQVSGSYSENYPKSIFGFAGYVLAGGAVLFSAYEQFKGPMAVMTDLVTVFFGVAAGVVMLVLSVYRLQGTKPPFMLHGFICLYLALRMFNRCQIWSNETQTGELLIPFLASVTLMLAFYQRTCFDVDMGKRPKCLLLMLLGTYLCMVAVLSFEDIVFYAAWALWLMTNLCSLQPLQKKAHVEGVAPGEDMEEPQDRMAQQPESEPADEKQ